MRPVLAELYKFLFDSMDNITWIPFLTAFLVSLLVTPLTIFVFNKLGWVIDPKKTPHPAHIHNYPVPKGGGIPIFVAMAVVMCLFIPLDKHILAIGIAMIITLIMGLLDDVKGSDPKMRLLVNFLSAGVVVASGIGIAYISNPLGGIIDLSWPRWGFELLGKYREIWVVADIFALIWIPTLMNAINFSSGVDGQISGVVTIAALALGFISLGFSADITQWPVAILAFGLAGAFMGLTIFHFYPQKIMPGYSATSLAGLMLGVLSILATAKVGALIVVLGIPLLDFGYLVISRVLSGKSPMMGDKNHLHHKLMDLGWGKQWIALFYWGITAILAIVAVFFQARIKLIFVIGLVILMTVFLVWQYSLRSSKQ